MSTLHSELVECERAEEVQVGARNELWPIQGQVRTHLRIGGVVTFVNLSNVGVYVVEFLSDLSVQCVTGQILVLYFSGGLAG